MATERIETYPPEAFAAEVRQRRLRLRVSRVELARRAGVHRGTIQNVEDGKPHYTATVVAIRDALEAMGSPTPAGLGGLAERVEAKRRTYDRLADDCWRNHDYLAAIRYRGMAEAYRLVVAEDLAAFAEDRGGSGG